MQQTRSRSIRSLRLAAKKLSASSDISYSQALDNMAKTEGFTSWSLLIQHDKSFQIKIMPELCEQLLHSHAVLLAAKQNVGKISLAINLALLAAKANKTVIYISLYSTQKVIREKFAAANSAISHELFSQEESLTVQNSLAEITNLPIKIVEGDISLEQIKSMLTQKNNQNSLVIIDYVQLLKSDNTEKTMFELKSLGKLNNISLLFISQLEDLVGRKTLTRHCDWVLSLHRDYVDNAEANPKKANLHILKSRVNSLKQFNINFEPTTGICTW